METKRRGSKEIGGKDLKNKGKEDNRNIDGETERKKMKSGGNKKMSIEEGKRRVELKSS